jgi:integrase
MKHQTDYSIEMNDEIDTTEEPTQSEAIEIPIINLDEQAMERRANPKKPWSKARELSAEKKAEFMTPQDVLTIADKISNIRDRALFLMLYICACRIEEVVRFTPVQYGKSLARIVRKGKAKNMMFRDYKKKRFLATKPGMIKTDISIQDNSGRKIIVFKIRNLKVKANREKFTKLIPLPFDNEFNKRLVKPIINYANTLREDEELFPFSARRAEQIIAKQGFNPHFFRKLRLTHLVKYNNFSDQKLVAFAGWTDSKPAKHYIKIGWKDLVDSM